MVKQTKKEVLLSTAHTLFSHYGVKRVSIEEICHEASVSKSTFYTFFNNKKDLVTKIHDTITNEAFNQFDTINEMQIPFPDKIALMGEWKASYISKIGAAYFKDLINIEHSLNEFKRRYLGNIITARKNGDVRSDINPELLWLVLQKISELCKEETWKTVIDSPEELQRQIRTLLWQGLLTRTPLPESDLSSH